jgi:hypothetical protein
MPKEQGTIALVGEPVFGAQVTFKVSTKATDRPWVLNTIRQNGEVVASEVHDMTPGAAFGNVFSLGPTTNYQGGDAEAVAELQDRDNPNHDRILATLAFHVTG